MPYTAPYIDGTGMYIPKYSEIRDDLIEQMKQIFGNDIYIDQDSMDYQQISIFAKKIFDTNNLALLVYNNRTPNTAIGVGLDIISALVGIKRKPATYSTVTLTITGDPNTVIVNGSASDGVHNWKLPDEVTIPSSGVINVVGTSEEAGNITAAANTITTIVTPTYGWISVTNNTVAQAGVDEETDAQLRGRYANATKSPSASILEGMVSSVEELEGVTRIKAYENDTSETDSLGLPPHSVTFVVEGGTDHDVASSIYFKKTPGCYTNGTTTVNLTSITGTVIPIRFYRPTYKNLKIKVNITSLSGYSTTYEDDIKEALKNYVNNLAISESVYNSILRAVVASQMRDITLPAFVVDSVQVSTNGGTSYSSNDITLNFNEASLTSIDDIEIEVD